MRYLLSTAVLSAFLAGQAALANPVPAPATSTARASEGSHDQVHGTASGEKVICRRDKEIGSRVKAKRICMTAQQWAAKTAEERQFVEQRQAQRTYSDN